MDEATQTELLGNAVAMGRMGWALRMAEAQLALATTEIERLKTLLPDEGEKP